MNQTRPKRVLHIIAALGNGGVESMIMNINRNMDKDKCVFDFIVHTDERKYIEEINKLGGNIYQLPNMIECGIIKYMRLLIEILRNGHVYHAVHTHMLLQNGFILCAAKLAGVKVRVSHSHLTEAQRGITKHFEPILKKLIQWFSTDKLACGREAGKFMYGKAKFEVINNTVDLEDFRQVKDIKQELEELSCKENAIIIGHVGRLNGQKNHDFIIELAESMKHKELNFCIFCVGDGNLEAEIRKKIRDKNLNSEVILLGARKDIPRFLKTIDVFILPSLYEGLPVVLVEAQAAGKPCIVSDTVTNESDLGLGLVNFLNLKDSKDMWIKSILNKSKMTPLDSKKIEEVFIEKKYHIKECANRLLNIYGIKENGSEVC